MNELNFQTMTQKELKSYVLKNREDQEAFYAYIDRLHVEGNWIEMPPMESDKDFENYPEFIAHVRRSSTPQDHAS
jgi:hypothetical protein